MTTATTTRCAVCDDPVEEHGYFDFWGRVRWHWMHTHPALPYHDAVPNEGE